MGKNLKYGEFSFAPSPARPAGRAVSTAKSTKGIPKAMYDAPHAMKKGGMCKSTDAYAKGGPKMPAKREPEAMVRKEVALLRKAGAPKALVRHEVREMSGEMDTPATKKAEVAMMRKAKAPLTMLKHEMSEPTGMKKGGAAKMDMKMGKVMREYGRGELHSGSKTGPVVDNPKQALAIAYSEGRKAKKMSEGGQAMTEGERAKMVQGAGLTEGERARMARGQYAAGTRSKMDAEGKEVNKQAKKFGTETQKYAKGGSVEAKLKKHASMPASKAHGSGAVAKLAKGGVPSFSRVPKFGQMK